MQIPATADWCINYQLPSINYLPTTRRESATLEKQLATWIKPAASIPSWDGGSTRYGGSTVRTRSGSDFLCYVKGTLERNHGEVRWNP